MQTSMLDTNSTISQTLRGNFNEKLSYDSYSDIGVIIKLKSIRFDRPNLLVIAFSDGMLVKSRYDPWRAIAIRTLSVKGHIDLERRGVPAACENGQSNQNRASVDYQVELATTKDYKWDHKCDWLATNCPWIYSLRKKHSRDFKWFHNYFMLSNNF